MHDVCAPISLGVRAPTDLQRAGIEGALDLWRAHGISTVHVVEDAAEPAAIELRFEDAAPPFHGLYDDEASVVYINRTIGDATPIAIVLAHELGHAFGLAHVAAAQRRSLMNPGNLVTPPNEADRAAVEALWGPCDRDPLEPR